MQINLASLAAGLSEVNQRVDVISKQKGAMHQDAENVGEPSGQPAQWGRQSRGGSSNFGEGLYTKGLRLEFPCFNGEDPDSWCHRADQFFELYDIPEAQRLSITGFHMEGKALSWFQALRSSNNLSTWSEFLIAIQVRFGRGSYDDPMETLSKLKQTGSLDDYKTQFEILANRVHRLIDPHKLSCFLGGLRDDIRLPVRMFNPKTLNDAYSLAKIQEECIAINLKSGKSVWYSSKSQGVGGGNNAAFVRSGNAYGNRMQYSQPKQYQGGFGGNNQQKGSSHENPKAFVPIQKISPAQMDERRKKGLCYSCDAKWSRGHVCDTPKLFLIEEIEEDSITVEEIVEKEEEDPGKYFMDQEPEISLNAITGTPNPKTMRMIGVIKGQQVTILIDSGSTHNFVDEQVAKLIGLKSTSKNVIKVRIANGQ
jgi:hypothetical protein